MPSTPECRENAEESLCLAKTARSERECSIYLQIAHTWLLAAAKLEGRDSIPSRTLDRCITRQWVPAAPF